MSADEGQVGRLPADVTQAEVDFRAYQESAHEHGWPPWAPTFLTAFSRLPDQGEAAKAAGIGKAAVHRLTMAKASFADAMEAARSTALDRLESTIFLRATIGTPQSTTVTRERVVRGEVVERTTITTEERHVSDILAMFYLKRYRPEFRERYTVEQSGEVNLIVSHEERLHEAADRFSAEVVRLALPAAADHTAANGRG